MRIGPSRDNRDRVGTADPLAVPDGDTDDNDHR